MEGGDGRIGGDAVTESKRERLNVLARALSAADGWKVSDEVDFSRSQNPRARHFWSMACVAWAVFMDREEVP